MTLRLRYHTLKLLRALCWALGRGPGGLRGWSEHVAKRKEINQ
jgi:hypothetical protein